MHCDGWGLPQSEQTRFHNEKRIADVAGPAVASGRLPARRPDRKPEDFTQPDTRFAKTFLVKASPLLTWETGKLFLGVLDGTPPGPGPETMILRGATPNALSCVAAEGKSALEKCSAARQLFRLKLREQT
jgi:hypothetical protein